MNADPLYTQHSSPRLIEPRVSSGLSSLRYCSCLHVSPFQEMDTETFLDLLPCTEDSGGISDGTVTLFVRVAVIVSASHGPPRTSLVTVRVAEAAATVREFWNASRVAGGMPRTRVANNRQASLRVADASTSPGPGERPTEGPIGERPSGRRAPLPPRGRAVRQSGGRHMLHMEDSLDMLSVPEPSKPKQKCPGPACKC